MTMGQPYASSGSTNLYDQVRQDIQARIENGEFKPGELLPTEEELCRQYNVSRITVRRAISDLAANFYVTRKRGVGTTVTRRPMDRRVFKLAGLFEMGRFENVQLIDTTVPAAGEIAKMLEVAPGTALRHQRLLPHRSDEIFAMIDAYTIEAENPQSGAKGQYANIRWLAQKAERAEQELLPANAPAEVAKLLDIKRGRPVMRAKRVYLDSNDKPVRYTNSYYHPDRYRFMVALHPGRGTPTSIG